MLNMKKPAARRLIEPGTYFLNVDLDVWSRRDPKALVEALGGLSLHHGRTPRGWHTSFEAGPRAGADATIRALVRRVQALTGDARAQWDGARQRDFNIGIQGGAAPLAFELPIAASTVAAVAAVGGRMVITVYGADAADALVETEADRS